jgi:hypothetical protein
VCSVPPLFTLSITFTLSKLHTLIITECSRPMEAQSYVKLLKSKCSVKLGREVVEGEEGISTRINEEDQAFWLSL